MPGKLTLYKTVLARRSVSPAVLTNGTVNGAGVDRQSAVVPTGHTGSKHRQFRSAMVVVTTGTITDGSHAVAIQDSDDNSTFAAVAAANLDGSPPTIVAADDNTQFEVGVLSSRRYLRVVVVTSGATSGGAIAGTILLGDPTNAPVR